MITTDTTIRDRTAEAFADPQPGDHFHEMFTWRTFVVWRDGESIAWMEASAPCTFPDDARLCAGTVDEFRAAYAYGTIPGYSVLLAERGVDVSGWLDGRIAEFRTDAQETTP